MFQKCSDYQMFYKSLAGKMIHKVIKSHLRAFCRKASFDGCIGIGYTEPYLNIFKETDKTQSVFSFMPAAMGAFKWPKEGKSKVALIQSHNLPLAANSVDSVFMIHHLEHAEFPLESLEEAWRILKSNGVLFLVVPNRSGMWSKAEWSPFGHGRPYSEGQLRRILADTSFICEEVRPALLCPPLKWRIILKSIWTFERFGALLLPGLCGVYCIMAVKQLYAPTKPSKGSAVGVFKPIRKPNPSKSSCNLPKDKT